MQGTKLVILLPLDILIYEPATAEGSAFIVLFYTIWAARGSARERAQSSTEIPRVTLQNLIIPTQVLDLLEAG
jgi:hypothetical protein